MVTPSLFFSLLSYFRFLFLFVYPILCTSSIFILFILKNVSFCLFFFYYSYFFLLSSLFYINAFSCPLFIFKVFSIVLYFYSIVSKVILLDSLLG